MAISMMEVTGTPALNETVWKLNNIKTIQQQTVAGEHTHLCEFGEEFVNIINDQDFAISYLKLWHW